MKIVNIIDDDYGCEDIDEKDDIKVILITDIKEKKYIRISEKECKEKNLLIGSEISINDNNIVVLKD